MTGKYLEWRENRNGAGRRQAKRRHNNWYINIAHIGEFDVKKKTSGSVARSAYHAAACNAQQP